MTNAPNNIAAEEWEKEFEYEFVYDDGEVRCMKDPAAS